MASPSTTPKAPSPPPAGHGPSKMERRMSHFKEYKFFRSFSAKVENWPMRKAEQLWRKMRERKIAGKGLKHRRSLHDVSGFEKKRSCFI